MFTITRIGVHVETEWVFTMDRNTQLAKATIDSAELSVSNSLSGGDRELDEVPAVGDPTHLAQIGRGHRVSTGERQRRVAIQ